MGLVQFLAPILSERLGGYNSVAFFDFMIPLAIVVSAVLTLLAVIGIWEKDRPEFFGVGNKQEKVKIKEYIAILKANKELQRLMVADCSDYETYRSGRYVPGIMGTLFSLVDKLVSSLGSTIVGVAVAMIGIQTLPDSNTPYAEGMHGVVIILFCVVPMIAWIATLIAMKGYTLTGAKMKEIQAVNAARKQAVGEGMSLEEAMKKWK